MQEPTRGPLFAPTTLCLESASSATPTAVGMAERILGPVLEKRFGAEPTSITSEDLRSAVVASGSSFPSHVKDEDIITAVENLSTDELSPIVASEDASDAGGPAAGSPRRLLLSVQKKATGGAAASSADAKRQRAGKLRGKVTVRISSGSILTSLTRVYHGASRCALLDSAGGLWNDCADCSDDRASYGTAPKGKFMIATDPSVERAEKDGEGIHLTVVIAEQRPATDESLRTKATISAFEATAVKALRAIARAADAEDWKNMIISEARNLLEMRKTESSATHKSLRKAQAKTAQANAKPKHLQEELMAIVKFFDERFRTILLADPIHGPLPDFSSVAPEAFLREASRLAPNLLQAFLSFIPNPSGYRHHRGEERERETQRRASMLLVVFMELGGRQSLRSTHHYRMTQTLAAVGRGDRTGGEGAGGQRRFAHKGRTIDKASDHTSRMLEPQRVQPAIQNGGFVMYTDNGALTFTAQCAGIGKSSGSSTGAIMVASKPHSLFPGVSRTPPRWCAVDAMSLHAQLNSNGGLAPTQLPGMRVVSTSVSTGLRSVTNDNNET